MTVSELFYEYTLTRGPIGLLRLELGISGRGKLNSIELVSEYIRCNQLHEVNLVELKHY